MSLRTLVPLRLVPFILALVLSGLSLIALLAAKASLVALITFLITTSLAMLGLFDLVQTRHAVLRNYPISAHLRFLLEAIRPEMRQYFFEDEKHGMPFSRDKRAVVYQRAKSQLDKRPFGTSYVSARNQVAEFGTTQAQRKIAPVKPVDDEEYAGEIRETCCRSGPGDAEGGHRPESADQKRVKHDVEGNREDHRMHRRF
jgi:glutamate synthase domain-containing protein 2